MQRIARHATEFLRPLVPVVKPDWVFVNEHVHVHLQGCDQQQEQGDG